MKGNPNLKTLIVKLKDLSRKEDVKLWKRVAVDLEKPSRQRRIVNISHLAKHTKDNESIVVPGKVLASGNLSHKLSIAAFRFSQTAAEKIKQSNGNCISINDLMEKNPKGKGVRIIG